MQVREIMNPKAEWIPPGTSIREAAQKMRDQDIGALPVGENKKLVGMVTDRDIVTRLLANGKDLSKATVKDALSAGMLYCFDDQDIEEVAANMGENQIRRLAVLDRDKQLVGMVSIGDIATKASERTAGEALGEISEKRN